MTGELRQEIAAAGRYLADRGLAPGTSGNISVRLGDIVLVTPTNSRLGALDAARISCVDLEGALVEGGQPSKEVFLHLGLYAARPEATAVVHLHSTYSMAASCLAGVDPADVFPALTAYSLMRLGRVPLVPFQPPGSPLLADEVAGMARDHKAMLLSNHGSLVASTSLSQAIADAEEFEQAAALLLMLDGRETRPVLAEFVDALRWRPVQGIGP